MAKAVKYGSLAVACGLILGFVALWEDYFRPITFDDIPARRATLIDQITSYQRIDAVRRRFESTSWKVIEDNPGPTDGRPPFRIYVAEVAPYSDHGQSGVLRLHFFNDRLMGTWFFPSDPIKYIEELKKAGLNFNEAGEADIAQYTRVRVASDYSGKRYVAWEDDRLRDELNKWVKRYS